jgi:hypothetical protein
MSIPDSKTGQSEFAHIFQRLAEDFKMTKGAVARSLSIERSYVSMILKGQRTPCKQLMEALRALEGRLMGGGDKGGEARQDGG